MKTIQSDQMISGKPIKLFELGLISCTILIGTTGIYLNYFLAPTETYLPFQKGDEFTITIGNCSFQVFNKICWFGGHC